MTLRVHDIFVRGDTLSVVVGEGPSVIPFIREQYGWAFKNVEQLDLLPGMSGRGVADLIRKFDSGVYVSFPVDVAE